MISNHVLRSVRYMLNISDAKLVEIIAPMDIIALIKKSGLDVSKAELGSFFRRPDHRNYRECGDQFLRNLLKGLTP
jgi:uncharacterized protein YehS (DUF1456 family)